VQDWSAVVTLLRELGRPVPDDAETDPRLRSDFEQYLARPDAVALLAEENGRTVGFLDMEFRVRLGLSGPQAWIPDLVVTEARQGSGSGRALIERAETLAREHGCWGMSLESATWREGSHAFYRRVGWRETGKSFTKPLGDLPWPPSPGTGSLRPGQPPPC
jgi:GNAT superfamily N-acetyltransferase